MTDTPRTETVRKANIGHPLRMIRMTDHARELERELNQWKAMSCSLAERLKMFGLCIPPEEPFGWRELLADFEELNGGELK